MVHQEVIYSSSDGEDYNSRKRKKSKGRGKDLAPTTKQFFSLRQSNRRSHKILPEAGPVFYEESDDDSDGDTDDKASDFVSHLVCGESSTMTSSILDGIDDFPMPNDDIAPQYSYTHGPISMSPILFMDSEMLRQQN